MTTPRTYPPFEAPQRVGIPTVTIDPPEFHVVDVYQVKFLQKLRQSPPATDNWHQVYGTLVSAATNNKVEIRVSTDGEAILVGNFPEPELASTVEIIDQALAEATQRYYPKVYDQDKANWERWHQVQADLQHQSRKLAGPNIQYLGEPQTGSNP